LIANNDREIFTTTIASVYELSEGHHQQSEVAGQALDGLAVECGSIDETQSISKFVAAARLVDVSDGDRVRDRDRAIACLEQASDLNTATDCVERLDYFYRWDIGLIGGD
jgi:hypothetical protein